METLKWTLDILGLLFMIPGMWLIIKKFRAGFVLLVYSNICFGTLGLLNGNYFFVMASIIFILFQTYGFYEWSK